MDKKILIICEGTKKEPGIFEYVQKLGLLPSDISIISYGTNIYKLYNRLEEESKTYLDGWNSLDIQLVISNMTNDEEEKKILNDVYTDILLIFDLDPQEPKFRNHMKESYTMFQKLMSFFNESTEHGKLYLSYPMIEALQHISTEKIRKNDFKEFYKQKFTIDDLRKNQYKLLVREEGEEHIEQYNKKEIIKLSLLHLNKAEILTQCHNSNNVLLNYDEHLLNGLMEKEIKSLEENQSGDVVSTSLFYLCEAYPKNFSSTDI